MEQIFSLLLSVNYDFKPTFEVYNEDLPVQPNL